MREFKSAVDKPLPAFKEAKQETPDYLGQTLAIVPLSMGVGLVVLIGGLLICWGFRVSGHGALIASGVIMSGAVVYAFLRIWADELYMSIETITGLDLNHDGHIGDPPRQTTHFDLPTGNNSVRIGEVDVPPKLLIDWCNAAWNRRSLSYTAWESRFALPDGTRGRERYQEFRAWLVKQEYAEEVGGNVGLRVRWKNDDAVTFVAGFADMDAARDTPLLDA